MCEKAGQPCLACTRLVHNTSSPTIHEVSAMTKPKLPNISYTYVLMDKRKPGNYTYDDYAFNYEPFYVGKGVGIRFRRHIKEALTSNKSSPKNNKIRKIKREGFDIRVRIVSRELSDNAAIKLERKLIKLIRRKSIGGPLTNLTDGGEGMRGYKPKDSSIRKLKESATKAWANKTENAKKASLANLNNNWKEDLNKWEISKRKTSKTVAELYRNMSDEEKAERIVKQKKGMRKFYDSRTDEQKQKASEARKRSWETRKALSLNGRGYK